MIQAQLWYARDPQRIHHFGATLLRKTNVHNRAQTQQSYVRQRSISSTGYLSGNEITFLKVD